MCTLCARFRVGLDRRLHVPSSDLMWNRSQSEDANIRASDTEIEFSDCGTWEYQG